MNVLEQLRASREALTAEIRGLVESTEPATEETNTTIRAKIAERTEVEGRITLIEAEDIRRASDAAALEKLGSTPPRASAEVRNEPLTYSKRSSEQDNVSYFKDLMSLATRGNEMDAAQRRLNRHAQEMDVELPARARRRDANAQTEARNAFGWDKASPFEQRVNPNRTDGQGGYLVPPLWAMDEFIPTLRAGRVVADQVRNMPLPSGTDSINIPKMATGTAAAVQTADAASVQSTDFTDTSVSAGVKTVAGQQDISIQLMEQSPLSLDSIIFSDLIADYNLKLDQQVLAGTNANGQVKGLYSSAGASLWTSYNQATYTDASPTAGELFSPLAAMLSKIEQTRYSLDAVKFFLHSRRWFWMVAAVDANQRPIVLPTSMPGYNPLASASAPAGPPGYKGQLALGFPAYTDPNITTSDTAGSGSGQDIAIALKCDDAFLFEGEMRQRTLPEILSGTLQVRFQIYNYVAFLLRYDQALSIASGTGFAAPSGF